MITLIIKGDLHGAVVALEKRGIKVFSIAWKSKSLAVHASVEDAFEDKVRNWFCEDVGLAHGQGAPIPFAAGTLLFYTRGRDGGEP